MASWRSLLFVPADDDVRVGKAASSAADAVILDLEDGVSSAKKAVARAGLADAVATIRQGGKDVLVRIGAEWRATLQDVEVALIPGVAGLMVPKCDDVSRLTVLGNIISEIEAERCLSQTALLPLIESAKGLAVADAIAAVPRSVGLALGSEDFALDMGVSPTPALLDLPCRRIALAAATGRVAAYALPVSIAAFQDEEATIAAATAARRYGITGALCIHPRQVAIVNTVFGPSEVEITEARAIDTVWADARRDGSAVIELNGRMIDAPVAARAARLIQSLNDRR